MLQPTDLYPRAQREADERAAVTVTRGALIAIGVLGGGTLLAGLLLTVFGQ